jgi:hypothetical protein
MTRVSGGTKGHHVGVNTEEALGAAAAQPEPGEYLVKNQDDILARADIPNLL